VVVSAPHLRPKSWSVVPPLRFSFCAFVGFLGFVGLAYEVIQYTYLSIYLSIYLKRKLRRNLMKTSPYSAVRRSFKKFRLDSGFGLYWKLHNEFGLSLTPKIYTCSTP
jgi:hypothetical protein